jgi:hypothetical protein
MVVVPITPESVKRLCNSASQVSRLAGLGIDSVEDVA